MRKYIDINAFTDDILGEVLKWLPVNELFGLKCICKRWEKLISSNYFAKVYQFEGRGHDNSLSTLLGFYTSRFGSFFPVLQSSSGRKDAYFKMTDFSFVHSHNGFVLFRNSREDIYRVCNPVTKQRLDLKSPYTACRRVTVAFDVPFHKRGTKLLGNFMIAIFVDSCDIYHQFTLYPGSTRWADTLYEYPVVQPMSFEGDECAVVINNVCYWLSISNSVLTRDLSSTQDSDDAFVKVIPLPSPAESETEYTITDNSVSILSVSKDGLLRYVRSNSFIFPSTKKKSKRRDSLGIEVWLLSDTSHWVFKHLVTYEPMCSQFPKMRYARLLACHPSDPDIIYILVNEIIVSYCFRNRRVKRIICIGDRNKESGHRPPYPWCGQIVPYFTPSWAASFLPPPSNVDD